MSKVAVVYWSGTGNTKEMAEILAAEVKNAGAEVKLYESADFSAPLLAEYNSIAFGCPAMGAEELEETEFEPMFSAVEKSLGGKKVALFGSYGWGDGEWMRLWEDRCKDSGIFLAADSVLANDAPDQGAAEALKSVAQILAA